MANYGRGWDDGYGSQSAEAMEAYWAREEAEAARLARRRRVGAQNPAAEAGERPRGSDEPPATTPPSGGQKNGGAR